MLRKSLIWVWCYCQGKRTHQLWWTQVCSHTQNWRHILSLLKINSSQQPCKINSSEYFPTLPRQSFMAKDKRSQVNFLKLRWWGKAIIWWSSRAWLFLFGRHRRVRWRYLLSFLFHFFLWSLQQSEGNDGVWWFKMWNHKPEASWTLSCFSKKRPRKQIHQREWIITNVQVYSMEEKYDSFK